MCCGLFPISEKWILPLISMIAVLVPCDHAERGKSCQDKAKEDNVSLNFKLERLKNKKWKIAFENAPEFVNALRMAPDFREPKLGKGKWLVLVISVWSPKDINTIPLAYECVESYKGKLNLGVRPMSELKELSKWIAEEDLIASPIWLVLQNGKITGKKVGLFFGQDGSPREEAQRWLKKALEAN
jgi:hypothetical protein